MNKWLKRFSIAGIALIGIGTVTASLAFAMGGRLHSYQILKNYSHSRPIEAMPVPAETKLASETSAQAPPPSADDQQTYSFSPTRELQIDADEGVVQVLTSSNQSEITVSVKDPQNKTQCFVRENKLNVKRESRDRDDHYNENNSPYITVTIPADHYFDKVEIDTGVSSCSLTDIKTSKLELESGIGSISFQGTVTGDIDVETGVGEVSLALTGNQTDYNYKIECGAGTISVEDDTYTMSSNDTDVNNHAPYTMDLECGVGMISVTFK